MTKLLTAKRSIFFVAFLALALVGSAVQQRVPTARGKEKAPSRLLAGDRAFAEGNIIFSVSSGTYDGKAVTFRLARTASAAKPVVEEVQQYEIPADINPDDYAGVDPYTADPYSYGYDSNTYGDYNSNLQSYEANAACAENMANAGAADETTLTIATAGHSLPLKADTYLPITLRGKLNGVDNVIDTTWTGTVLARAGFSAENPVIELPESKIAYGTTAPGVQTVNASANGGFNSIKINKWKTNLPFAQNIDAVAFTIETSGIQYDAVSATLNVKQSVHLKKNVAKKGSAAE